MKKRSTTAPPSPDDTPATDPAAPDAAGPMVQIVDEAAADDGDFEVRTLDGGSTASHGWLFHSDELLPSGVPNTYRKPVAAIHAVPEKRDAALKLSARKLMEAMPLAVQMDLRKRGQEEAQELIRKIREDRAAPLFEIRTKELARLAGLVSTNMERVHETLAELVGLRFVWNVMGEDGEVEYEAVTPFLIRRDRGVGVKAGYTRFAFEPEVLLWFLEPTMWATLSWTVLSSIGRAESPGQGPGQLAAFGLYQNIWRYMGTKAKVTPTWEVATWIDLILGPSRFVKVDAKGEKRVVDYKDFKRRCLVPGLDILNNHPALNHTVELKEILSGRKVVELRFKFHEKVQGSFDLPLGWPPASITQLDEIGFTDKEIANMSQLYQYNQVAEALKRLPAAEQRMLAKGSKIYSRQAFFSGILGNVVKGEAQNAEEETRMFKEAVQRQQIESEAQRMGAMQAKFKAHQRTVVTTALQGLSKEDRDALIEAHLTAKPADRIMHRDDERGTPYMALFCQWLASARAELWNEWLPEPKDQSFQSWLVWQASAR